MTEVLYLSYDGMTDPLGQSQVLPYLIGLSEKGFQITLISFEKPERFQQEVENIKSLCLDNNIDWKPLTYTKRPPVFSTIYDVLKLKKLAKRLQKEKNIQLVHCRSYITMLVGLALKNEGAKLIFDMRGFWADERVEGNIWNLNNPLFKMIFRYFKRKERNFLNNSDAIVSLTEAGKNEILSWNLEKITASKITVIPCCVNETLFSPNHIHEKKRKALQHKMQLSNHFVVGYIGSIGTWYLLDEMLYTFKQIKKDKPDALFLFVTKDDRQTILNAAKKRGVSINDIQIVAASHSEVPLYISLFDVSIFYILPSFSKKASSPTKQGEIMAMGIPLICNAGVGDTDLIVQKYAAGQIVKSISMEHLKTFKLDLSHFEKEKTKLGATEFFGLKQGIDRYASIYNQVLQ